MTRERDGDQTRQMHAGGESLNGAGSAMNLAGSLQEMELNGSHIQVGGERYERLADGSCSRWRQFV